MIKDINGNEIRRGIVRHYNYYYKIFITVGDKLGASCSCDSIEDARQQNEIGDIWESQKIANVIEQIEYESLGVCDSNGKEYKYGDVIQIEEFCGLSEITESTVVGAVPSLKLDDQSFIIHVPTNENYKWIDNCKKYKIIRSILNKKADKGEKLIKETIELCKKTQEDMKSAAHQLSAVLRKLGGQLK